MTQTSSESFDVVVAGGGPAGSTVATLLAQRGHRVLVLEREQFPRYHVGESMISGMVPVMRELGLEQQLDEQFQLKFGVSLVWGNEPDPWRTEFNQSSPFNHSWHVDRAQFDELLLNNARAHGVEVIEQARVLDVLTDDQTAAVVGLRYEHDGVSHEVTARYVVDASGQARVLSRHLTDVNFKEYLRNIAHWQYFTGYQPWSNPGDILIEAVPSVGGWLWAIPITEDKVSIGWGVAADDFTALRNQGRSAAELYDAAIAASKEVCKVVAPAELILKMRSARDYSHAAKDFAGPGWLAVGDAAAFIDPLFSSGVWLSTSGAWLAARALDAALSQPGAEATAFERYEQVYLQIVEDMFAYVLYFSDPHRNKEDYLEKAAAGTKVFSENSQVGFISLISGITALPQILNFDPVGEDGMRQAFAEAVAAEAVSA